MVTHIELTEREKTIAGFSGDMIAVMELAFPQDAGSRSLYLEEWEGFRGKEAPCGGDETEP